MSTTRQIHSLFFDSLPATNSWVKEHIETLDPKGLTCVIAKQQTAGRGQFERKWISAPGNLLASFYFTTHIVGGNWAQLLSLSTATALQKKEIFCSLKWPNDLMLAGKKVGGILCETVPLESKAGVILGIGLNCSTTPEVIDQPVTSLTEALNTQFDAAKICHEILSQFVCDLALFEQEGFAPFHALYCDFLNRKKGDPLCIKQGSHTVTGTLYGIDLQGHLIIEQTGGSLITIFSGTLMK